MSKSVSEIIDNLQSHVFAYEILFQSLLSELPDEQKQKVISNAKQNFAAFQSNPNNAAMSSKIDAAKVTAGALLGAKL